jgi:hypothetical protein
MANESVRRSGPTVEPEVGMRFRWMRPANGVTPCASPYDDDTVERTITSIVGDEIHCSPGSFFRVSEWNDGCLDILSSPSPVKTGGADPRDAAISRWPWMAHLRDVAVGDLLLLSSELHPRTVHEVDWSAGLMSFTKPGNGSVLGPWAMSDQPSWDRLTPHKPAPVCKGAPCGMSFDERTAFMRTITADNWYAQPGDLGGTYFLGAGTLKYHAYCSPACRAAAMKPEAAVTRPCSKCGASVLRGSASSLCAVCFAEQQKPAPKKPAPWKCSTKGCATPDAPRFTGLLASAKASCLVCADGQVKALMLKNDAAEVEARQPAKLAPILMQPGQPAELARAGHATWHRPHHGMFYLDDMEEV